MALDLSSISQMAGPILNAMPHPVFIVDEDVVIHGINEASQKMIGKNPELILKRRAGEILHCIHSTETEDGCGRSVFCKDCIVRSVVIKAFGERIVSRENTKMEIVSENGVEEVYLSVITSPFEYDSKLYVLMLFENITELMQLRKIVPICCNCHNIRNDNEYWHKVDSYFEQFLDINFSHSLCPDCIKKLYPDFSGSKSLREKKRDKPSSDG